MSQPATVPLQSPPASTGSLLTRLPLAIFEGPMRLVRMARERRRQSRIEREFDAARLALGERMYQSGIDDGETSEQIAAVGQQIVNARIAGHSWEALEAEREPLILRLADAALENDAPLPGAEDEFRLAWDLKQAVAAAHLVRS